MKLELIKHFFGAVTIIMQLNIFSHIYVYKKHQHVVFEKWNKTVTDYR